MNTLTKGTRSEQFETTEHLTDSYAAALTSATKANEDDFKMRNILVMTRPSKTSVEALKYAGWLALQFGCQITILHAIPRGCCTVGTQELQSEICRTTGIEPPQIRAIFIRQEVKGLSPILDAARDEHADLVVIPADFYKAPLRFWQMSMIEKLARHTRCPVLVAGNKALQAVAN